MIKKNGLYIILSSPSGAGKTTLAKKLIQNNGNFFYCDSHNNLVKTMQALTQKLNIELMYCTESILQELLVKSNINYDEKNTHCEAILSSCEYLISHQPNN